MGQLGRLMRALRRGRAADADTGVRDATYYDRLYAGSASYRAEYWRSHYYFLWCVIADRLRRSGLRRVLEVGCGPGQLAAMLFDLRAVDSYAGLDFSPEAIALARRNVPGATWEVDDARTTTLHARCDHDVVICTEVLEHVEDDLEVVARFRPGVRCLCTVPSFAHESHVRRFADDLSVAARYAHLFDEFQVVHYRSPIEPDDLFFLIDGFRR